MSETGLSKLKSGNFNIMYQEIQTNGSVTITLSKRGEKKVYKLKVKDLYKPTEVVLEEQVIET